MPIGSEKSFKFLFVGDGSDRKGMRKALEAYLAEFTYEDDVCLAIKSTPGRSDCRDVEAYLARISRIKGAPEVYFRNGYLSPSKLPNLYTACNCSVQPYMAEGFCLPVLEAMACGLPTIVTNYGACLDFCHTENSFLIQAQTIRSNEKRVDPFETVDFPVCGMPSIQELRRLMRYVYENEERAKEIGLKASREVLGADGYTWQRTAERIVERLEALNSAHETAPRRHDIAKDRGVRARTDRDRGLSVLMIGSGSNGR